MESEKEIFPKRIRELRGTLTQKEFAYLLGVKHQLISDYETGRTEPTKDILEKFIRNGKVNLTWLLTGSGSKYLEDINLIRDYEIYGKNKFKSIPVVGTVGCGSPLTSWETYGDKFIQLSDIGNLNSPFALIAKGDSMLPYINPGDFLICSDNPEKIKNGRAVIISFKTVPDTTEANAKLIKFLKDDFIMLYSVNTKYDPVIYHKKDIYKIFKLIRIIREVK